MQNMTLLNYRCLRFGAWCGTLYSLFALVGWWAGANFIPPHAPAMTPEEVAAVYEADAIRIRVGMIMLMIAAGLYIPFTAAVAYLISRIEGCFGVLSISQTLGGMGNVCLTFYPAMWWLIASYRQDGSAEFVRLLNDIGWLQIVGGLTPFLPVLVTIAVASFHDKSDNPPFPRWTGFF